MNVVILDYGAGNVQSVIFALKRLGIEPKLSKEIEDITMSDKVIFPGVGEASSAMIQLQKNGLDRLIPELKQPVLGICLGMQLMCAHSEEGNAKGMGIFPVKVKKFIDPTLKIPQIGWNQINIIKPNKIFDQIDQTEHFYFVHGYYVERSEDTIATCNYGIDFAAAMNVRNFYAVQFHPEKSAKSGEKILSSFLSL